MWINEFGRILKIKFPNPTSISIKNKLLSSNKILRIELCKLNSVLTSDWNYSFSNVNSYFDIHFMWIHKASIQFESLFSNNRNNIYLNLKLLKALVGKCCRWHQIRSRWKSHNEDSIQLDLFVFDENEF